MKELGISGWSPTSGAGQAEGVLVTDAAHSSDRIWTLDLQLTSFSIDGLNAPKFSRRTCGH